MNSYQNQEIKYQDDASWSRLLEMADNYEEIDDEFLYDNYIEAEGLVEKSAVYNTPEEALKVLFGYDSFREGQKPIIDNILLGRDVFAIMLNILVR